ncbi:unnamed protein product [Prorocentrum cordatum]|uniref:Uncharacterized protein n=1 Tax=Prorocentrum cordatum TaxID=2364126 RepID=A0ABN9T2H2_9DINO|nr:unnamed protein product [Polarella glacialis]
MRTRSRREEKKEEEQEEEEEEEEAGGERRAAGGGRSSARALCLGCLRAPPPAPQTPAGVGASGERILFRRVAQQRRLTLRGAANSTSTNLRTKSGCLENPRRRGKPGRRRRRRRRRRGGTEERSSNGPLAASELPRAAAPWPRPRVSQLVAAQGRGGRPPPPGAPAALARRRAALMSSCPPG